MVRPLARSTALIAGVGTKSGTKPRRAEAPVRALCWRQSGDFDDFDLRDWGDNELRHPRAAPHHECIRSVIDKNDLDLAAIIRIDRSRGVQDGDAIASSKTGAGPDLALVTGGQREGETVGGGSTAPARDF